MSQTVTQLLLILFLNYSFIAVLAQKIDYVQYVNPMVGTGGHGHTFPGATVPFGMVQLSPDTRIDGSWDGCSGYHNSDTIIYGFSHTHLSGTGVSDYGDFMLMPLVEKSGWRPADYGTAFSKKAEVATPGYYAVKLNSGIEVKLTASTRAGFHEYAFPESNAFVLIDLRHRDALIDFDIKLIDNKTIALKRISNAWATEQHAYAFLQFDMPFTHTLNEDGNAIMLNFSLKKGNVLKAKMGFSFVDTDGAKLNLNKEIPHWNFKKVHQHAIDLWNKELSKIKVSNESVDKTKIFYTALYHTMIHPNIANDIDGRYRGRDLKIHQLSKGDYYTVFSLWDTFRALHPLLTIIDRKRTNDFIETFLLQYQQGGALPVWELASNETGCMIGYHAVSVIADAILKNIGSFDVELAYAAMKHSANIPHLGINEYKQFAHLSIDHEHESVSKTLEYAYDDWCIAQVAKKLNKISDYKEFMMRAQNWKNLLDEKTKMMRPRINGNWLTPFDPYEVNNHYTEANAWQYAYFVPQMPIEFIQFLGGDVEFENRLDAIFNASTQTTGRDQADITGLIGQYVHGNEPSHHIPFMYQWINRHDKTEQKVHQILNDFYSTEADGLIGNEDCGQMSAWAVLAAMGMYQVSPGDTRFQLFKPWFKSISIHLESNQSVQINNPEYELPFSKNVLSNQLELPYAIDYKALMKGGTITYTGSSIPPEKYPKPFENSLLNDYPQLVPVPVIISESRSFNDSLRISIKANHEHIHPIYYMLNHQNPILYEGPFYIHQTAAVSCFAKSSTGEMSGIAEAKFYKRQHQYSINITQGKANKQYTAGGSESLMDGIFGSTNWRKGDWQGYQGQDIEIIINLKKPKDIAKVSANFLQDTRAWILFPSKMSVSFSSNGKDFTIPKEVKNDTPANDYTVQLKKMNVQAIESNVQFVKINIHHYGKLPKEHAGAGHDAFFFIDEIEIE